MTFNPDYTIPPIQSLQILGGQRPSGFQTSDLKNGIKPVLYQNQILVSPNQMAAWRCLSDPTKRYSNLVGGTRSGKTWLIMLAVVSRALKAPGTRHVALRLKANAARGSIALDTLPSVVKHCFQGVKLIERSQDGYFILPNESEIWVSGLDDKDRIEKILGKEFSTIFLNEASQIPYSSHLVAMTRLAQVHPKLQQRCFIDLNPTGKKHWTNMLFGLGIDPMSEQPIRNHASYTRAFLNPVDNAHNLSEDFISSLTDMPAKQRKRFFEGVYQDEVDGALWSYELIESLRVPDSEIPPGMRQRVVIAVDPSGAKSSEDLKSDEIGICVAAKGSNGHGYILADLSMRGSPQEWALRVCTAYEQYGADAIIAEANFGGAMVEAVIKAVNPNVNVRMVTASRGKVVRAEPIAALYERKKVHHVGTFRKLEDQLCSFSSSGYLGGDSPDHADAAIWAMTELLSSPDGGAIIEFYKNQLERQKPVETV